MEMIEILLVDDESYVTESLALTIPWVEIGVEAVYQATSALEALEIMERQQIDILVTDIRMPEQTGLQLIEQAQERWPNIRAILLTGYSDFEYAKKALRLKAVDYLLKPVNDEQFITCITGQVELLRDEWKRVEETHQQMYSRKGEHSLLQRQFMHDILLGRTYNEQAFSAKLEQYEVKLEYGQSAILLTAQLAGRFIDMDRDSAQLIEYAVGNIAEEIFPSSYRIWHSSSPHECVVIVITLPEDADRKLYDRGYVQQICHVFQQQVSKHLDGGLSIVISDWFTFPTTISQIYREALTALYRIQLHEPELVLLDAVANNLQPMNSALEELYKPPTFIHLLESAQWQSAKQKLDGLFQSDIMQNQTRESIYEAFIAISNGIIYVAHKKGLDIRKIDPHGLNLLFDRGLISSAMNLKTWSYDLIDTLQLHFSESDSYQKKHIIKQVQELVNRELGIDTSVKTIADRVFLHPVYLSKLYKSETGESLGDFIIRMRMEKAVYMLKSTNKKIYEITTELGYQNPQYFSKIFRKYYGCTPNEFRDQ